MVPVYEMLTNMKVKVEAARALLYETARIVDIKEGLEELIEHYPEKEKELKNEAKRYTNYAALYTPIAKAYNTEICNQVAYDGIQIHGGTGFMRDFNAERHYRDARITNIYEGTTQLQVVAAIGGVITGVAIEKIHEYKEEYDISKFPDFAKKIDEMTILLEKSITFVKQKNDPLFQEYHSRRLVEMTTNIIIGYLLAKDAVISERKVCIAKNFLEFAHPENKMKCDIILNETYSIVENHASIIDGKN